MPRRLTIISNSGISDGVGGDVDDEFLFTLFRTYLFIILFINLNFQWVAPSDTQNQQYNAKKCGRQSKRIGRYSITTISS